MEDKDPCFMKDAKPLIEGVKGKIMLVIRVDRPPRGVAYKEKIARGSSFYYSWKGGRLLLGDNDAHLQGTLGFELHQKDTRSNGPTPRCQEQNDRDLTAEVASGGLYEPYAPKIFVPKSTLDTICRENEPNHMRVTLLMSFR